MKKILITGASGLLGKALLTELEKKERYALYGVTTSKNNLKDYPFVTAVAIDLTKRWQVSQMLEEIKPV